LKSLCDGAIMWASMRDPIIAQGVAAPQVGGLQAEAVARLREYRGRHRFALSLRRRLIANPRWVPTSAQAVGLLRVLAWEAAGPRPRRRRQG